RSTTHRPESSASATPSTSDATPGAGTASAAEHRDYAPGKAYTTEEGRQELLDTLAEATDELGFALAALGAAYEQLDEANADRLEAELFGPVQVAYGRAKRTHAGFASRHGMPSRTLEAASPRLPSAGPKRFIHNA